jgi:hypothetical protein
MIHSEPYKPDPKQCCEACVFGRGKHAEHCQYWLTLALRAAFETTDGPTRRVHLHFDSLFRK